MTPHSYSLDSQSKSSELASKFLDANSPPQISAAISAVESHLTSHSPDQNRHFFSLAFPAFLYKFFGFDVSSSSPQKSVSPSGWIDRVTVSNDPELSGKLFNLLSPNGTLMSSIMAVDRLSLVKFVFPSERLPEWVRFLLSSERECRILPDLCLLFKGRIKEDEIKGNFQVHLNVFEYFMFWFAYYPVCRGNCEKSGTVSVTSSRMSKLENWALSIPVISSSSKRTSEQKNGCNLYLKLLYAYLRAFVPMDDLNAHHHSYRSSLLHYSPSYDDSVVLHSEFLVETLVHYWLVDGDFSPLAVNVCKSFGLSFPFHSVLGETPPASGLGEVVKLFVKYLNLSSIVVAHGSKQVESFGSPFSKKMGLNDYAKLRDVPYVLPSLPSGGSWNSYIQRPLYRFILRTFLYCPMGSSVKNISEVFYVWIDFIEPWRLSKEEDFAELDAMTDASKKRPDKDSGNPNQQQYSADWQGYVLSNYLFYTSLVMHFIGFAHKFLHTDAVVIVQMISRVIDVLISSRELLELIKNVDAIFHSRNAGSGKTSLNYLNKFIPQIREQLQDWEDGLSESDADGSFLHENWNRDLKLFNDSEDGGSQLLQLFIMRAETEIQATSGDNLANNLQSLNSLKPKLHCLFGDHVVKHSPLSPRTKQLQNSRDELFKPRRLGNGSVSNDDYKGDWLRRPISDDEVAWLAKLMIRLSSWLNQSLGLYQGGVDGSCPYVEVPTDVVNEYGISDFLKVMMCSIASWLIVVRLAISRLMIRHGLKVNLRVFASKKFVTVVLVFALFNMLRRAFRSIC
ncbi:Sphingomyelin phosphodiesterase 4 [Bienertia sinuspersici]